MEAVLPFPASVISLLLLLVLVLKIEQIREKADFLLNNLGFFLVPVSVSLMNYVDVIRDNVVPFFIICIVSTILTFAATAGAVRLTCRIMEQRKRNEK